MMSINSWAGNSQNLQCLFFLSSVCGLCASACSNPGFALTEFVFVSTCIWKKDQRLQGCDYMLHLAVTFLIREHTDAEDVEQVESELVWCQRLSVSWPHILAAHRF